MFLKNSIQAQSEISRKSKSSLYLQTNFFFIVAR